MDNNNINNSQNDDIFDMMNEEEINSAFGDIIETTNILIAKGCRCSKPWDYC